MFPTVSLARPIYFIPQLHRNAQQGGQIINSKAQISTLPFVIDLLSSVSLKLYLHGFPLGNWILCSTEEGFSPFFTLGVAASERDLHVHPHSHLLCSRPLSFFFHSVDKQAGHLWILGVESSALCALWFMCTVLSADQNSVANCICQQKPAW